MDICEGCHKPIEGNEDYIEADWDGARFHARDECLGFPFVLEQWLDPDHPYVEGFVLRRANAVAS